MDIGRRFSLHAVQLDALVDSDDACAVDAVARENRIDRIRCRDKAGDLVLFRPRERVRLQMVRDAPRCDEGWTRARCQERERQRRQGNSVRIVRVNDVGSQILDDAGQPPSSMEIDLCLWRQTDEVVPFGCACGQLTLGMGDEHGPVSALAQAEYGEQHLTLTASPRFCRIDLYREQVSPAEVPTAWRTSASRSTN